MFWVDAGESPERSRTCPLPKTLAEYAYDKIKVPETEIELKPTAKSTVNLPTWVWLDKGTFQEVKVRAELPNTGLWAETTAKPVALHLDPGTPDATTYPASGDCTINEDGSIGTPYAAGKASEPPPCGITYLRATDGSPYQLKASVTWEITWQGSDGTGGNLAERHVRDDAGHRRPGDPVGQPLTRITSRRPDRISQSVPPANRSSALVALTARWAQISSWLRSEQLSTRSRTESGTVMLRQSRIRRTIDARSF